LFHHIAIPFFNSYRSKYTENDERAFLKLLIYSFICYFVRKQLFLSPLLSFD